MRGLVIGVLAALCSAAPAWAIDVTFTGVVLNTCTLAVPTPGIMSLSSSGKVLSSDLADGIGVPATLTIISLGGNTITFGAPTLDTYPVAYSPTGQTVQIAYQGLSGLSSVTQAYTSSQSSFAVGILPITSVTVNMKITNNNGFAQGSYTGKTVVTCS
jgi:hypothetical protein